MSDIERVSRGRVESKRSWDIQPVGVDWHDFLINKRVPGSSVSSGFTFRPPRADATGLQYRCSTAGVLSSKPFSRINWPALAGTVTDGSAIWTAEAISSTSLVSSIASDDWPAVDGVTLATEANADLKYQVDVSGGANGQEYEIIHRITLANGQRKEWVVVLPVKD